MIFLKSSFYFRLLFSLLFFPVFLFSAENSTIVYSTKSFFQDTIEASGEHTEKPADESGNTDEFKDLNEDEFKEFSGDEQQTEFLQANDSCLTTCPYRETCAMQDEMLNTALYWVLFYFALTILAGIFVRFNTTRNLKGFFLLTGLAVIGFYKTGCPCMLSSFQETILVITGQDIDWRKLVWFIGLIPLTYVFGRVWCGWICHLGALQEFLFLPRRFHIFKGYKTQKIMKIIRIVLLAALIIQLIVNPVLFFCKIDPFKAVFNLQLPNHYTVTTAVLLGLLLLTSLFSFRPFCRGACPIGLILGWVQKIPGASVIGVSEKCSGCLACEHACRIDAITRKNNTTLLDNKDCIVCGECLDSCRKGMLQFFRKNKQHHDKITCRNNCET